MSKFAYFPGCSADATGISFTLSSAYVTKKIGIELVEIPDWCCCGTSAALVTDEDLALALPARSMALSEQMDPTLDVATPCAGCFASLRAAWHYAQLSDENRAHLEDLIEMPYAATSEVFSFLEIMARLEYEQAIADAIQTPLKGLKVASYYGCALVRPKEICKFDDVENPQSMDRLIEASGATAVDWAFKTECCGASHHISEPKAARILVERIFEDAAANGATAIATACPLCFLNLDMREKEINDKREKAGKPTFDIPVFYFTELLGLAMGASLKELGVDRHFHPAKELATRVISRSAVLDVQTSVADVSVSKAQPSATASATASTTQMAVKPATLTATTSQIAAQPVKNPSEILQQSVAATKTHPGVEVQQ